MADRDTTPDAPGAADLVHAVSWASGEPQLVVANALTGERRALPVVGERLAFRVDAAGRFCLGRRELTAGGPHVDVPCPGARLATQGIRCDECAARDESRFMHHAHRGGYVPEAMKTPLAQPHWLYVATFADGTSKIGTATDARKRVRLDEQGAVRATYVARADDGYAVRVWEDAVTEHVGLPQTKHKSAKVSGLSRAARPEVLDAEHAAAAAGVEAFLRSLQVTPVMEIWQPPVGHAELVAATRVHPPYPHSLTEGEHCLMPRALVGAVALVNVNDDDEPMLVDLDHLRGRRVTWADVRSPETAAQHSLF